MEGKFIPQIKSQISINKIDEDNYVLCNLIDRHYLKVNSMVHDILLLVDGKRSLFEISKLYREQARVNIDVKILENLFFKQFAKFGIIEGFDDQIKEYRKPGYLTLSFIIFNKKFLGKIVPYFYFLFNRRLFSYIAPIAIIFILSVFFLKIDLYKNMNVSHSFLYFIVLMAISVTFHEIGHASAANFFGASHGGIGGGFFFIKPVYFADVTDIWRLKTKERIIVNLAGIYFELIFCCMLLLYSLICNNDIILFIALIIFVSSLFNLNPFFPRSDGFWIVTDITGKTDIYKYSRRKMSEFFSNVIRLKPTKVNFSDILLILYSCISYTFLAWFLFIILIKNPEATFLFPLKLFKLFQNMYLNHHFSVKDLFDILPSSIFYYLLIKYMYQMISKKKLNRIG